MTLTELRYIVAVARERHFGRAATACQVSQPSLSVAIRKLEEELGVKLFERRSNDVGLTPIGNKVVEQASKVLMEAKHITEIAQEGRDPLGAPLRLGVIYTIAPYLLPRLVQEMMVETPKMPLYITEGFTTELVQKLRSGQLDVLIIADTLQDPAMNTRVLYQEDFVVAVPSHHPWVNRSYIGENELRDQTMLLLGAGHCFRDQILDFCPDLMRPSNNYAEVRHTVEGSSLQTISHMVIQGLGITVLPASSVPFLANNSNADLKILPFKNPAPSRRVILMWRKSFSREAVVDAISTAVSHIQLNGCYQPDPNVYDQTGFPINK